MEREWLRVGLPPLPAYMMDLPIDKRGFPVPWFTPKVNGEWDFQAVPVGKAEEAMRRHTCWICGKKLFRNLAYVIGPMCAVNRASSEPASHVECAEFAAKACPFLTRPRMRRSPKPEDGPPTPGIMLERNPGVCLVWVTRSYKPIRTSTGMLVQIGDPIRVSAWSEGRPATQDEVLESIRTGVPELAKLCKTREDVADLILYIRRAMVDLKLPEILPAGVMT